MRMVNIYADYKRLKREVEELTNTLAETQVENAVLKGKLALTNDPTIIRELTYQLEQERKKTFELSATLRAIQDNVRRLFHV